MTDIGLSSEAIIGRKMGRGDPVGEGWLYGRSAVELIVGGHVTEETMRRYRSAAYFSRKSVYGTEPARKWEDEAKARHEAARHIHRDRKEGAKP